MQQQGQQHQKRYPKIVGRRMEENQLIEITGQCEQGDEDWKPSAQTDASKKRDFEDMIAGIKPRIMRTAPPPRPLPTPSIVVTKPKKIRQLLDPKKEQQEKRKPLDPKKDPRFTTIMKSKTQWKGKEKEVKSHKEEPPKKEEATGYQKDKKEEELTEANKKGMIYLTPKHFTSIIESLTQKNKTEGPSNGGRAKAGEEKKGKKEITKLTTVKKTEEEKVEKKKEQDADAYSLGYDGEEVEYEEDETIHKGAEGEEKETKNPRKMEEAGDLHQQILDW